MKKLFLLAIAIASLTACTTTKPTVKTTLLTYQPNEDKFSLNGGKWIEVNSQNQYTFDKTIDDEIKIVVPFEIQSVKPLEMNYEYSIEFGSNEFLFYTSAMYEYMETQENFYFEISHE